MKTNRLTVIAALCLLTCSVALQGCLKDTCSLRYTLFTPVYKSVQEVRANIKSNSPQQVVNPGKLFVMGNYIFLNEVDKGIHIIDNTNRARPVNKYFIDIPGNVDMAVKGNTLYADLYADMVAIDITNPASARVTKVVENAFPYRRYTNGFVPDTTQVIVGWNTRDTIVDCNNNWVMRPGVLFMEGQLFSASSAAKATMGIGGSMARFALQNDYLYTATSSGIKVFETANAQEPTQVNNVDFGWGIETIYPFKDKLFIGSMTGMFIFEISNPVQPTKVGMFSHARVCDPVIADDDYAFVTLRSGSTCAGYTNQLDVLNIQNITSPQLLKSYMLSNPHGLSKYGNLLIICDGASGLKVFDATDVNNLKLVQTIANIDAYDVITYNDKAIVTGASGLYQYSINSSGQLALLSQISIVGRK